MQPCNMEDIYDKRRVTIAIHLVLNKHATLQLLKTFRVEKSCYKN